MMLREPFREEVIDDLGGDYDPGLYAVEGTVTPIPGPFKSVADADLQAYRRDGFLAISDAVDAENVAAAEAGVRSLVLGEVPGFRGIQWERGVRDRVGSLTPQERLDSVRKLIYFTDAEPRLNEFAQHPSLMAFVARILGEDGVLFADQALLKPPGIGREKPWHQDLAFFDLRPGSTVVGLWFALDQTDASNGCMHVIPGSHHSGPAPHFNRRDFQICDSDVSTDQVHAVPLDPGGCLVFDGLVHHGTPQNSTRRRRWALQLHYAPQSAVWTSTEERAAFKASRMAAFGAEGGDAEC